MLEKIPFFILCTGIFALRIQSQGAIAEFDTFTIFERIMFASYGAIMYLVKLFAPVKLSAFYPYPNLDNSGNVPVDSYLAPVALLTNNSTCLLVVKEDQTFIFCICILSGECGNGIAIYLSR